MLNKHIYVLSVLLSGVVSICNVSAQDSIQKLSSVDVVGAQVLRIAIASTPIQVLNSLSLKYMHTENAADAIKHFSGVNVKDFGGIGGLKTVSIRSLGAAQTAVSYDGITINDGQNGQVDLGKIATDGIAEISLSNGSFGDLLQPARTYAAAGLLNIKTGTPAFNNTEHLKAKISAGAGSFGFMTASAAAHFKFNRWTFSILSKAQKSEGDYTFDLTNGNILTKETRANSDAKNVYIEQNSTYKDDKQEFLAKLYLYESERGLPGAVILYNTYSAQRLSDRNYFAQTRYTRNLSAYTKISLAGKYNNTYTHYLDTAYIGRSGPMKHEYKQNEAYFSAGISQRIIENLYFSIVSDYTWNDMEADIYAFPEPVRQLSQSVFNVKYKNNIFDIHGNVLYCYLQDDTKIGATKKIDRFSPALSFSIKPFHDNLQFRTFFKETYRMPTFNELYYTDYGNYSLNPEISQQFDFGITYYQYFNKGKLGLSLSGDVYYNKVKDKIIAIPGRNLFLWTMKNLGKVDIIGVDMVGKFTAKLTPKVNFHMESSYTFQYAVDITNPNSRVYGDQIPYTPRHSASSSLGISNPWINVDYNILYAGKRYALSENIAANELQPYTAQSIALSHTFKLSKCALYICGEILNFTNAQYEVVNYYPMPGRSYKISMSIEF